MEKNGTVMDYLRWRGDLPFTRDGFNEVDDLVLCIISYINFRRFDDLKTTDPARAVALPEVAARLTEEDEQLGLSELDYIPLMRLAAETERFREVRMFASRTTAPSTVTRPARMRLFSSLREATPASERILSSRCIAHSPFLLS